MDGTLFCIMKTILKIHNIPARGTHTFSSSYHFSSSLDSAISHGRHMHFTLTISIFSPCCIFLGYILFLFSLCANCAVVRQYKAFTVNLIHKYKTKCRLNNRSSCSNKLRNQFRFSPYILQVHIPQL